MSREKFRLIKNGLLIAAFAFLFFHIRTSHAGFVTGVEVRRLPAFSSLAMGGDMQFDIKLGQEQFVQLRGAALANVINQMDDQKLIIRYGRTDRNANVKPYALHMRLPALASFQLAGKYKGVINNINQTDIKIIEAGQGETSLSGQVETLSVNLQGNNTLDAEKLLVTKQATINTKGNIAIKIKAAPGAQVSVDANGTGTIDIYGKPILGGLKLSGGVKLQTHDSAS